ncbi:MAG TPA: response regulator [Bryobacteraceae bacterium]|nr:response regulator [Bryobacteraceae bacterium]
MSMTIFLAEDNPADIYLLRIAFDEVDRSNVELIVAKDGEEALEWVRSSAIQPDSSRPDLFVLDLNLPKADGSDILRKIREADQFRDIPVVVLTSSDSPRDREAAERLGATDYLTKPTDLNAFLGLGGVLLSYAGRTGPNGAA